MEEIKITDEGYKFSQTDSHPKSDFWGVVLRDFQWALTILIIMLIVAIAGIIKGELSEGLWAALGIGLVLATLFFSAIILFFGGISRFENRRWLRQVKRQESHPYRKRFIIGAVTFLMATVAFMGVEYAVVVGAALIVLAFCANILTNQKGILAIGV